MSEAAAAPAALASPRGWPALRFGLDACLLFVLFFVLALGAIAIARQPGTVAVVWIANGAATALIVSAPQGRALPLLGVAALANLMANLAWGDPIGISLAFLPANVLEVALAVALVRPLAPQFADGHAGYLRVVLCGAVIPPLLGATLGSAALHLLEFGRFERVWIDWYVGSLLGSVVALSFGLALRARGFAESLAQLLQPAALVAVGLSVLLTWLGLVHLPYPFVWIGVGLMLVAYALPRLAAFSCAFAVVVTLAVVMALGGFVPSVARSAWNNAIIYLTALAVVLPALVSAVAMARQRVLAEMLSAVGSRTDDIVVFVDMQGVCRWTNRAREHYWGVPNTEVVGQAWSQVTGEARFDAHVRPLFERSLAGEHVREVREVEYPKRGLRTMDITMQPAYDEDGRQLGVLSCASDISELVQARRELERKLLELAASNASLEQFVRIASHDLREPMNTIAQFVGLIEQKHSERLDADGTLYFAQVREGAQRMKTMLDDVLQFVRIESGEPPAGEVIDLDGVMAEVRQSLQARLLGTRGELVVEPLGQAWGRRSLVALVLQNLVSNALKFVPPGRTPRVHVAAARGDGRLRVTVADNGIGIEAAKVVQLGTPFRRLHSRRKYEGTGLGLAICKRIAEQHDGAIEIASTPGEGSRFALVLPERGV